MSEDFSNRVALVCDDGQFLDVALRLARDFGKVYFWNPGLIEGFPKAGKSAIGQGFKAQGVEWVKDIFSVKNKVDLFVFGDILTSGIQLELESQGKRVVGSRTGDRLEIQRIAFKKIQKRLGLNVPVHEVIDGLAALRAHLRTVKDKWVKISEFRGSFETKHHTNYELSESWLNKLACELGPLAEEISYLVEDPIKGKVEFGYDGFCIDGRFPSRTIFGPEVKSKCYIGSQVEYEDLDERLREVNEALSEELSKAGYRNFFSTEVRIADGDENFADGEPVLIEPTCRAPSPPFECEMEVYSNLSSILWHGAAGEVVEPEMAAKFAVECRLLHDDDPDGWRALQVPEEVRRWVKLYDAFQTGETTHLVPKAPHAKRIGAVVGLGNTIEDAIAHCKENLDALKDQPVSSEFDSFADALKEIKAAEEQDIEFTKQEIPEPAVVLEST